MEIDDDNRGSLDGFTEPVVFNEDAIDRADDRQGVHVVWADGELIFVGQSAKTRTRLRQHFTAGRSGSVLHKQIGDLLDDEFGREATKEEIGDWLRKCTVGWRYDAQVRAPQGTSDGRVQAEVQHRGPIRRP